MEESESEKTKRIQSIQYQYAFELFCQKRFQESFKVFADLDTGEVKLRLHTVICWAKFGKYFCLFNI